MRKIFFHFCCFIISIVYLIIFFNINTVTAADLSNAFGGGDSLLDSVAGKGGYNPGTTQLSINYIIGDIVMAALSLIGVIFLILMVYGGYVWMTSHGDEQKVTKAKNTINAAIIGIIIVVSAYAISYFVVKKLGSRTLRQSTGAEAPPAPPGP